MSGIKGSLLTLPQRARDLARRVAAEVLAAGVSEIVTTAKARAPVDSGAYRRLLTATSAASGEKAKGTIRDGSGYGPRIVSRGVRPWLAHVSDPARELVKRSGPKEIVRRILAGLRVRHG